jgi:hypothetical protein
LKWEILSEKIQGVGSNRLDAHGQKFVSRDNCSGSGGGAGTTGIVNPQAPNDTSAVLGNQLDNRANRGLSDFDRTHRLVFSYLWDLPPTAFGTRYRSGRLILSGWQLSGIVTAMSGLPIDVVDQLAGSLYGLNNGFARPNFAPGADRATATSNIPDGYFFNPYAFARPVVSPGQPIPSSGGAAFAGALGTDLGDVRRNILRGPRQVNVDFGLRRARAPVVDGELITLPRKRRVVASQTAKVSARNCTRLPGGIGFGAANGLHWSRSR